MQANSRQARRDGKQANVYMSCIMYVSVPGSLRCLSILSKHHFLMFPQGMAVVGAVDCDDKSNQRLCAKYEIRGFPTLKVSKQQAADL